MKQDWLDYSAEGYCLQAEWKFVSSQQNLIQQQDMGVKEQTDIDEVMAKGREAFYRMRQAAAEAGLQDMTLDEINEEIRLARESK